jgi:hypothetical protein
MRFGDDTYEWQGEAPCEPEPQGKTRLGGSLALPVASPHQ